ncbi:hypothetical protein DPMN_192613 [Dreissena polymorpha]|uniref:Uncharacterized protein n=1 Tax=Dreissena polymorpha TaxID=45954 RepID=A0A9D4B8J0_DREPO|nr:hypothetical protein DPMN_192613 [Dreissena polymorpha]
MTQTMLKHGIVNAGQVRVLLARVRTLHLSFGICLVYPINDCGIQGWGKYIDDASHVPQTVDTSDSESDVSTVEE